ncbi:MAG: hypothetical protein KA010_00005, partial [Saprospiraceae bacterium]|nr:hypothetical protein [Saprospiraceae bacterium]
IFNDPILNDYPNLVAEMSPENNIYKYTVGVYRTYSSAEQLLRDIIKQGYSGAFIVPYINGIRLNSKEEAKKYTKQYPDLSNYINKS